MPMLWQDLKYGARRLLKQPTFTLTAIFTLALGIGANSAIFSVVNAVLLRPLPYKEPEQLVKIWETLPGYIPGGTGLGSTAAANFRDWREQSDAFTHIAAFQSANVNLQGEDAPRRVTGLTASASLFDLLGVPPQLGRTFQEGEDEPGRNQVVVLSDKLWRRDFGADPQIIGQSVPLNGESFTVIGVMPPGFEFPNANPELWMPLVFSQGQLAARADHNLLAIGRIKPGVTRDEAQEQMRDIALRLAQRYPEAQASRGIKLNPLQEEMVQPVRPALLVLLGAVGFVLVIACMNVANLLLVRATTRRRETAIRLALGAGRAHIVQQFLTESLLLAVAGGALGLLLAKWGVGALMGLAAGFLPRASEVGLDWRVTIFTLLLSLCTGVLFGLAPALASSKPDVQAALKESDRTGNSVPGNWMRSLLVVAEVALALILLVGAGLLIRSFIRLQQADAGLRPENVLTLKIGLPATKYKVPQAAARFFEQALERVSSLSGVEAAGLISRLPVQESGFNSGFQIEGREPYAPGQLPVAEHRAISPDTFRALGIPLLAGRAFNARDREQSTLVAIINQTLARSHFADQHPIGKRISIDTNDWRTIVGVVGDVRESGITQPVRQAIFIPYTQTKDMSIVQSMSVVARTAGEPAQLTAAIRNAVREVDPAQPIYNVKTMETVIADSLSNQRLNMLLLGVFAAVAVTLASVGIYIIMSYTVAQNTREIGIRMALGAQVWDTLKLVMGQGMVLTLIGIGIGIAGAFALSQVLTTLLFGVTATDPMTFAGVPLLLMGVALLACYVPARRATKVDPMVALRYE